VVVEGISYRDVWALTQARTTNGRNLVPGSVELNLNYRFAPSRSLVDAETDVFATVSTLGNAAGVHDVGIEITDRAPPAPPHAQDEVVRAFVERVGADVTGKQAWTDVARFAELGVPALNFGPGRTDQAHQRGEYVEVAAMVDAYDRLASFLGPDA
jgi:succinyl-diaminopimelate desuccinylase